VREKPAIGYMLLVVIGTLVAFAILWAIFAVWL
jgi:hypothetical protein